MKIPIGVALLVFIGGAALSVSFAQERGVPSQEGHLRDFLRMYLKAPKSGVDISTRYSFATVDLGDSRAKQVVVYVTGRWWCGSGGCLVLVLEPEDAMFKVLGRLTIARPPVRVLQHKTMGWHDLSVWMQGGGIQPGHYGVFAFDGKRYQNNPSVASEPSSESGNPLPLGEGTLLYQ